MSQAAALRLGAEALAGPLPALLAEAEHLAATVQLGEHGRRRAGQGDEFWQYRAHVPGDETRAIDWRRSARSDGYFVREKEWQAAQSILLWVDRGQSMTFSSKPGLPQKGQRARLLALALAVLLNRGGERVGLTGLEAPPRSGPLQLLRIAQALLGDETEEYARPRLQGLVTHGRAAFFSDFLGDISETETALFTAADRGIRGALVQVLDPEEEAFPFDGRTIFESMGGGVSHETLKARELRDRYLDRLAERKDALQALARKAGWQFQCHHTDRSGSSAMLWLYGALERSR